MASESAWHAINSKFFTVIGLKNKKQIHLLIVMASG
jgi:hypothetical protein